MAERFTMQSKRMNYLYVPDSGVGKRACCNLGYQMQHSVRTLEEQLAEEGRPHVLQLNMFNDDEHKGLQPIWTAFVELPDDFADERVVRIEKGLPHILRQGQREKQYGSLQRLVVPIPLAPVRADAQFRDATADRVVIEIRVMVRPEDA